jgi:hypothetical protein
LRRAALAFLPLQPTPLARPVFRVAARLRALLARGATLHRVRARD